MFLLVHSRSAKVRYHASCKGNKIGSKSGRAFVLYWFGYNSKSFVSIFGRIVHISRLGQNDFKCMMNCCFARWSADMYFTFALNLAKKVLEQHLHPKLGPKINQREKPTRTSVTNASENLLKPDLISCLVRCLKFAYWLNLFSLSKVLFLCPLSCIFLSFSLCLRI